MKYYYYNPDAREVLSPLVEHRSLTGSRSGEVGFFAAGYIKSGSIIMTTDTTSLLELDDREDLQCMREWAEFLAGKLPLSLLSDLYPRTLEQARTLPILSENPQSQALLLAVEKHLHSLSTDEQPRFLQESLLLHKLVANAFSYTERYMCLFHRASVFNHSSSANLKTTTNGKRMVFQASRDITTGEELTINYGNHLYD